MQPAVVPQCHARRLSVLGLQHYQGHLTWTAHWERVTSAEVIAFFDQTAAHLERPLRVVLDNAQIHRAKAVKAKREQWREQGLELEFLPAYSPELNRIEILWKKLKHFWLPFTDMAKEQLEQNLYQALYECGNRLDIDCA